MLVQLILILGVAGIAAALVPLLPDLRYVVNYGLTMMFFMSGIFFSLSDMSPEAQQVLMLNPMLLVIDGYRAVLLHSTAPSMLHMGAVAGGSALTLLVVWHLFRRFDRIYPRVIG